MLCFIHSGTAQYCLQDIVKRNVEDNFNIIKRLGMQGFYHLGHYKIMKVAILLRYIYFHFYCRIVKLPK